MLKISNVLMVSVFLIILFLFSFSISAQNIQIGISQLVEHPALDAAREGFIDALAEEGFVEGENIEINVEMAQADLSTAQTIARKFKEDKKDLILTIATPCAQATANVIKDIPILITAVTDPVAAKLVESLENPQGNITGTTDMNPVADQLALIKEFLPSAKKIGILYNSGEVNSVVQVDIAKEAAPELGLEILEGTATNTSEVGLAASSLVDKVDAFYLPTDNTIASAVPSIIKVTNNKKVPVFAAEKGMVENGAIATKGIDYYKLGKQTGHMAAKILNGAEPSDLPIEGSNDLNLTINKNACEQIDLEIPAKILEEANEVIE